MEQKVGIKRRRGEAKFQLTAIAALVAIPAVGFPCMAIGFGGGRVGIDGEAAIIVWDETKHEEQFIRTASFSTDATSMSFLVPTPSLPILSAVENRAFYKLEGDVASHPLHPPSWWSRLFVQPKSAAGAAGASAVVMAQEVGEYQATVLSLANRPQGDKWLFDHKFPVDKAAKDWLDVYAAKKWVLTAFVMKSSEGMAALKAVRMTFHTDQPFYPYREPASTASGTKPRELRVYFLGDGPVAGRLGNQVWPGAWEASDFLTDEERQGLASALAGSWLPKRIWMTAFLDSTSPRRGTDDVIFLPAPEPSNSVPYEAWALCFAIVAGGGFLVARRVRTQRIPRV